MNKTALMLIGTSASCPDIEYLAGFRAVDPILLCRRGGRIHLVVPEMEADRAERAGDGIEVLTPRMLRRGRRRARGARGWAVAVARKLELTAVRVPSGFPHGVARALTRAGVRVIVLRGDACPERAVKTAAEWRHIRDAQQAAVIAMRAAVAAVAETGIGRDGRLNRGGETLTAGALRALINRTLLEHHCICTATIVAGGVQGADPHEIGAGPLRAHEPIVIDIFPQHQVHGYCGDLTRTIVRGRAPDTVRRMYAAVRAAQNAALDRLRAGASGDAVHRAAADTFVKRRFDGSGRGRNRARFIHGTGHGVGLAVHESPRVSPGGGVLEAGNVVTIEPGLYDREIGGVRLEDTVLVTDSGWKPSVPCEKRLEV